MAKLAEIQRRFETASYREHCLRRIIQRGIDPATIREATFSPEAEVFECYANDPLGPSCLVLGWWNDGKPLHIEYALGSRLYIVTVWDPSVDPKDRWEPDFKTRRKDRGN